MTAKAGPGPGPGGSDGGGNARQLKVRLRSGKSRTPASKRWLTRQINDPYVARAQSEGLRSRAAFKLAEIDERFHLLKPGAKVADLGAAPGGWSQIAAQRVGAANDSPGRGPQIRPDAGPQDQGPNDQAGPAEDRTAKPVRRAAAHGKVVAIDLIDMAAIPGVAFLRLDFLDPAAPGELRALLGGPADLVLSDMAANATGHRKTDHLKIMALAEATAMFARETLKPGGAFLCKVLQGGTEGELLAGLKRDFATVKHVKPAASRADSAELYVLAMGFRGALFLPVS
jgi:23S rRNA (uridine2552-2'-O)-methyltransferase